MLVINKIVKWNIFLVIFLAFLAACSSSDNNSLNEKVKIKITDGYFLLPPPGRSVTAGYLNIQNNSEKDITLIGIDADKFSTIEVHEHRHEDGIMKMRKVDNLMIPSKRSIVMRPGGYHLMIFGITEDFVVDDVVDMNLKFYPDQFISTQLIAK